MIVNIFCLPLTFLRMACISSAAKQGIGHYRRKRFQCNVLFNWLRQCLTIGRNGPWHVKVSIKRGTSFISELLFDSITNAQKIYIGKYSYLEHMYTTYCYRFSSNIHPSPKVMADFFQTQKLTWYPYPICAIFGGCIKRMQVFIFFAEYIDFLD